MNEHIYLKPYELAADILPQLVGIGRFPSDLSKGHLNFITGCIDENETDSAFTISSSPDFHGTFYQYYRAIHWSEYLAKYKLPELNLYF